MKKIIVLFYNFLWGNEPIFPDSLPPEGFEFTFDHDRLQEVLKTVDIRSPKTVISVHFSSSKPMAMQIY